MFERNLTETLRWYLGARGRLGLGAFNWLLFFVFLPLLFWQIHIAMNMAGELRGALTGGGLQNLQNLVSLASGGGSDPTFSQQFIIPALPYVLMFTLWPALIMRLRDIGWDTRWAHVIMAGNLLGLLNVWGLAIPFIIRFMLGCAQFYIISMLAMKGSKF